MSDIPHDPPRSAPTVFLSYASEDRQAARALRDGLRALGLEIWYDESALDGGDAWDQKIRRQIRECDYFMPLISAQTAARPEGYFRREWRLAVERTLDMADDHPFLLPVVIDAISEAAARVPERFLSVQWLRVPGGQPNAALEALGRRLLAGEAAVPAQPARRPPQPPPLGAPAVPGAPAEAIEPPAAGQFPPFPRQEPGQRTRFAFQVLGWSLRASWIVFMRLPRWVRILVYVWLAILLMARGCMDHDSESRHRPAKLSSADAEKLKAISQGYQGSTDRADLVKLGAQIAQQFSSEVGTQIAAAEHPVLAVPFTAPSGDASAQKLADSTFAEVYGRVAISLHGRVGLAGAPLATPDAASAAQTGRAQHSTYVIYGAVDNRSPAQRLTVAVVKVEDGSVVWSDSWPVTGADSAHIAAQIDAKLQEVEDD
ncbi:MAG TPA: TIR domain-containing protein [Steroidobacteraceae bacterium]|jgi:TolB-like protein|nr:TIR domain-containing protein [Steroidobacteraceae bacterium]